MQKPFIDTNIWIYACVESPENTKHELALSFLEQIKENGICISVQVLNELHWTLSKKFKVSENLIESKMKGILEISNVFSLSLSTYSKAVKIRANYNISFWDSLLVASAIENNVDFFYSEDLQDRLIIEKTLTIVNPFV